MATTDWRTKAGQDAGTREALRDLDRCDTLADVKWYLDADAGNRDHAQGAYWDAFHKAYATTLAGALS